MTELLAQAISAYVNKQFALNQDTLLEGVLHGTDRSMSAEEIYPRLVTNSMKLSVQMSVQIMSELLLAANVIEATDEEHLRKILLSVVKD